MQERLLGQTGLMVSALGFGCGSVGGLMVRGAIVDQRETVALALDAGVTYFDTAPMYGDGRSEENLGRVLTELRAWGEAVVGTKVRLTTEDLARPDAAILSSVEQSLRRLGRGSVDLLQLHNPVASGSAGAGHVPVDDVLAGVLDGLQQVIDAGMVRHAGFTALGDTEALRRVIDAGSFATMQAYFNAVNPSAGFPGAAGDAQEFGGIVARAAAAGLGVLAIRVLAAGALSGSGERAHNAGGIGPGLVPGGGFEVDLARTQTLVGIAAAAGLESTLELAVRFALSKPGVSSVLAGLSNREQLESAIRWTERGGLAADLVEQVVAAARSSG